jgi:uncharacterized Rossmann fold enzyme
VLLELGRVHGDQQSTGLLKAKRKLKDSVRLFMIFSENALADKYFTQRLTIEEHTLEQHEVSQTVKLELNDWWPWYEKIIGTFGYDKAKDQFAADLLSSLLAGKALDVSALKKLVTDRPVLVFGAGPSLEENLKQLMHERLLEKFIIMVADGATTALLHIANTIPEVIVTDLDGIMVDLVYAQKKGATIVIHAHGDNIDQLRAYVPKFSKAIGSTQVEPCPNVYNFLGFTDGDRAVFLAAAMAAKVIVLAGMDFGAAVGKYSKNQVKSIAVKLTKLKVSKELLEWLASQVQDSVKLYNVTASAQNIKGFKDINAQELKKLFSD